MKYFISLSALTAVALATPVPEPESAPVAPRDGVLGAGPWTIPLQLRKVDRSVDPRGRVTRKDVPLTTWLRYTKDMQWYAPFTIGTPPQKFTALFDTAFQDILIPSINCTTSCGTHNRFDGSKSTTYSPLPGQEYDALFGTGGTPVPLSPPQGAHIKHVTDKICLAGLCVPQQPFYAASTYAEALNDQPLDGLFGLSIVTGSSYWWETVVNSGQVPSPEFSFFMIPGLKYGSELTLGGRDPTKFKGPVTDIDLNRNISLGYHAWIMDLPAVYIDGQRVTNKTAPGTPPLPYGLANMDSATASIVAPDYETARDLYAQISPEIYQIDPVGAWGAKCDVVNRVAKAVTFTFGETGKQQINLTMPASAFNAGPYPGQERNNICQSIILNTIPPARDAFTHRPGWVIGGPVFRNYYSIWNGRDLKMSFAKPIWKL